VKNSRLDAAGSSARMDQLVAAPAACVIALGLLFGAIPAQAQPPPAEPDGLPFLVNFVTPRRRRALSWSGRATRRLTR
jgi:hypothetical protein